MNKNIQTTFLDYPDNESLAIIFYMNGCEHNCFNCQNKELQQPISYSKTIINEIIDYCNRNKTNKIVLSGGDPLYKTNIDLTNLIIDTYKDKYDICIYTGYDIKYIKKVLHSGFKFVKSGKYNETLKQESNKTDNYMQLASSNQNFYNNCFIQISQNGKLFFK